MRDPENGLSGWDSRRLVHVAVGVLMERDGIGPADAVGTLVATARNLRAHVVEVAADVVSEVQRRSHL